ncbi:MAG: ABC transporter permease, partial [Deltaproteobacteria bacterium]|nr:ABC transporter permease [Deltaproteobacteria bacterium]
MFRLKLKKRHKHLLSLVKENKLRLFLAMGCMLIIAISTSATAFLVKPVLDDIFFNKDTRMLSIIPIAVILIYFLRGLGSYGQEYLMNYVGEGIIRNLRNDLYD